MRARGAPSCPLIFRFKNVLRVCRSRGRHKIQAGSSPDLSPDPKWRMAAMVKTPQLWSKTNPYRFSCILYTMQKACSRQKSEPCHVYDLCVLEEGGGGGDIFKPVHESSILTLSLAWGFEVVVSDSLKCKHKKKNKKEEAKRRGGRPVKEWPDFFFLSHRSPRSGDYESSSDSHSCSTRSFQLNHFSPTCSFFYFHLPKCKISSKQRSKKVNNKKIKGC